MIFKYNKIIILQILKKDYIIINNYQLLYIIKKVFYKNRYKI